MHTIYKDDEIEICASPEDYGQGIVLDYFIYGLTASGDPRVVPSLNMVSNLTGVDPRDLIAKHPWLESYQ